MNQPTAPNAAAPQQPSWFSRNWKWLVPVVFLIFVALIALSIGALMAVIFGAMKSSDAYKYAVAEVTANAEVQQRLGQPIETGFWVSGSVHRDLYSGTANLVIPISGPKAEAEVYVVAAKNGGDWEYSLLQVGVEDGGEDIVLIDSDAEALQELSEEFEDILEY